MKLTTFGSSKNPPALFLHGYGAHPRLYQKFVDRLAQTHHVFVPEIFGLNGICRQNFGENLEAISRMMHEEKLTASHVVGHSYGALAVMHLAAEFGDLKDAVAVNPLLPGVFTPQKLGLQLRNMQRDLSHATGEIRGVLTNPVVGATYGANLAANPLGYLRGAAEALTTTLPKQKSMTPTRVIYADLDTLFHLDDADLKPWRSMLPNITFEPVANYSHNWLIYHGEYAHEKIFPRRS